MRKSVNLIEALVKFTVIYLLVTFTVIYLLLNDIKRQIRDLIKI